jgi:ABC-2 type transport system permease protein
MKTMMILLKKEWMESIRKHRLLVLFAVFLLFGITSPLMAKYMPEIIRLLLGSTDELTKIGFELPDPTIKDSYIQYYKNLTQMGIFVQILVFMNLVSEEKTRGTAVLILTKSVSRAVFMVSKLLMAVGVVVLSLIPSYLAFYFYTFLLFDEAPAPSSFIGLLMYVLLSLFILTFTYFASTVSKSSAISALISIGGYFAISIVSAIPKISDYFPMKLTDAAYRISLGVSTADEFTSSIVITLAAIVFFAGTAVLTFRRQEL